MTKSYSVADVRRHLPDVLDEVEAGAEVRLTRRGKPVAVLVSVGEYDRLTQKRVSFAEALAKLQERFQGGGEARSYWESLRDRGPGRKVSL